MDPYRYLSFITRKVMQAWVQREQPPAHVAWTPLHKPLADCRVALLASAAT